MKKISFTYQKAGLLLLAFILLLLFAGAFTKPYVSGDGAEYLLMAEAFENHLTPAVTDHDIAEAAGNYFIQFPSEKISETGGFFKASNGGYYSYHFWGYSLLVTPFKILLNLLNGNELGAFYFCNAALFFGMLLFVFFRLKADEKRKFYFLLLIAFNPILFYMPWTHAEVFSYSFACAGLVLFFNRSYLGAVLLASIAAMQNQPLVFLGGMFYLFFCIEFFTEVPGKCKLKFTAEKIRRFIKPALLTACGFIPFFIPLGFYFVHYGTFSLIAKTSAGLSVDVSKILSLFFDLNFGMILFVPLLLLLFFPLAGYGFFKTPHKSILYLGILLVMAVFCSFQSNWNSGTAGINRYAVWMTPLLIYFVVFETAEFSSPVLRRVFSGGLLLSGAVTFWIVCAQGLFLCTQKYTEFTPLSKYVMGNFPALYNPQHEIFAERVTGLDGEPYLTSPPKIFCKGNSIKKILMNNDYIDAMKTTVAEADWGNFEKKLDLEQTGWYYINFSGSEVRKTSDENTDK